MGEVSIIELILRVFAATIVGALIGYEREIKNKPAGFYTFILVCVGSCLIAILQVNLVYSSIDIIQNNPDMANVLKVDSGRVIAQVVSGIGFLGAGTIIHNRANVKGITTAAMLWLVASLGLMIGTGGRNNYIIALVTVVIILPIASFSRKFSDHFAQKRKIHRIRILFDDSFEKDLYDALAGLAVTVKKTYLLNKTVEDNVNYKESIIYIYVSKQTTFESIMNELSDLSFVREIEEA